jgi:hypothetical protein
MTPTNLPLSPPPLLHWALESPWSWGHPSSTRAVLKLSWQSAMSLCSTETVISTVSTRCWVFQIPQNEPRNRLFLTCVSNPGNISLLNSFFVSKHKWAAKIFCSVKYHPGFISQKKTSKCRLTIAHLLEGHIILHLGTRPDTGNNWLFASIISILQ